MIRKMQERINRRGGAKQLRGLVVVTAWLSMMTLAHAQSSDEGLSLSDQELMNLGIRFVPATAVAPGMGVRAPGLVIAAPAQGSQLFSTVEGEVGEWLVNMGDSVKKGELLAVIFSSEAAAQQSTWIAAQAGLETAQLEATRIDRLVAEGIVSQRRQQQAQIVLQQAIREEAAAAQSLARLGFDEALKKKLSEKNSYMGYALLRAPYDGMLVHQAARRGQPVSVGDELAELEPNSNKWLSIKLSSKLARGLSEGGKLSIADSSSALTLRQRDYSTDTQSQTVELLAEFDSSVDYPLGTKLEVIIEPSLGGVLVPATAVVYSDGQTQIFVREGDSIRARALNLRPIGRDYAAVSGLSVGESIAVVGTALLKGMQLGLGGDS